MFQVKMGFYNILVPTVSPSIIDTIVAPVLR